MNLNSRYGALHNSWLLWVFFIGVIVTVLFAVNYQGTKGGVPISEIFTDEEIFPVDIAYDQEVQKQAKVEPAVKSLKQEVPVAQATAAFAVKKEPAVSESAVQIASSDAVEPPKAIDKNKLSNVLYTIQVASFKEKSRAEKIVNELKSKEHFSYIGVRDLGEKGKWYRVYVGRFNVKTEADAYLSEIKKLYKSSFIISPK